MSFHTKRTIIVNDTFKMGTWESNIFKVAATFAASFTQREHLCC